MDSYVGAIARLAELIIPWTVEFFGNLSEDEQIDLTQNLLNGSNVSRVKLAVSVNHCQTLSVEHSDRHIDHLAEEFDLVIFSAGIPGSNKPFTGSDQLADYWISQFQIRGLDPIDHIADQNQRMPLLFATQSAIDSHPSLRLAVNASVFDWRERFKSGPGEVRSLQPGQRIGPDTGGQVRRIAASVVTYQPTQLQIARLRHLADMFDQVVVVDNSEPPKPPVDGVEWISMGGNKGIASALNAACKRARERGYEWLFTLDQDTELEIEAWDKYVDSFKAYDDKDGTAIVAPRTDGRDIRLPGEGDVRELEMVMTSGCLTNLQVWSSIGGFADELFIDEVDHEYCLNARKNGYRVVRLLTAYLPHQPGKPMSILTRHGPTIIGKHPPNRLYYIVRNYFFMKRRYEGTFPEVIAERRRLVIAKFKEYLLYHRNRWPAVFAMIKGAWHGLIGRFGR